MRREVENRGDKPQGATHRIENGVLILGGCGSRCSVNYTVEVPAGVPVRRADSPRDRWGGAGGDRLPPPSRDGACGYWISRTGSPPMLAAQVVKSVTEAP